MMPLSAHRFFRHDDAADDPTDQPHDWIQSSLGEDELQALIATDRPAAE